MPDKKIKPIRLHLELKETYLSDRQQVMLKRYGESTTGNSITRDIIIPSDMPLHNLTLCDSTSVWLAKLSFAQFHLARRSV